MATDAVRLPKIHGGRPSRAAPQNGRPTDLQASIEHYTARAVNAAVGGDHVQSESYYQQAEYYIKVRNGDRD
jgi:hypothetical protein